jgi:hypothetical protein
MIYYINSGLADSAPRTSLNAERLTATGAQTRIGLQRIDHTDEVLQTDDPFELETGAIFGGPDQVRFDSADLRQANDDPFATIKAMFAFGHETMGRDVNDMHVHVTQAAVFADHLVINRVPGCPAQIGNCQLRSGCHAPIASI